MIWIRLTMPSIEDACFAKRTSLYTYLAQIDSIGTNELAKPFMENIKTATFESFYTFVKTQLEPNKNNFEGFINKWLSTCNIRTDSLKPEEMIKLMRYFQFFVKVLNQPSAAAK